MKPVEQSEAPAPAAKGEADGLRRTLEDHALWVASQGREGRRADLSDADLSGASLAGRNLSRALLTGVDLSGADLSEAVLDGARMIRARLVGADLLSASLVETNLTWANLKNARLASAVLTGACLADSDLTGARLRGADFTNADLEGADLRGAELTGTVMNGTDLTGARFDTPGGDAHVDAAYEADAVLDTHHEPMPVSELPDADLEDHHHGPEAAATPQREAPTPPGRSEVLAAILDAHARWLATDGAEGRHADLGGFDLAGLTLAGVDLAGADLATARNLTASQLAGTDLTGARLPEAVARFPDLERIRALAMMARRLLVVLVLLCGYTVLVLATDTGRSLGGGLAALRLPVVEVVVPVFWFHLGAPLVILTLYAWLHVYLTRMFEALGRLPAVFPDGTPLDRRADPWLVTGLVRAHMPRLRARRPSLWWAQQALAVAVAWGAAPATLIFLWGAYAPRGGLPAATYHAAVASAAFGFGLYTFLLVRRALHRGAP